jgi:hypothetical protein
MQAAVHPYMPRLSRALACAVAVFALLFLLQVAPHSHATSQDEAACRLCQAAHVSATPAITGIALSVPFVLLGEVTAPKLGAATESFLSHPDSRAPPTEVLL